MGGSKLKIKVVAKGNRAKDLAATLAGMPDSSRANYVSRNDLHVAAGASSGVNHAAERVPHKAVLGIANSAVTQELKGAETAQANLPETGSKVALKPEGFGPSYHEPGVNTVKPVMRDLNPVERARQSNNRTRDMRTNLGRSKSAIVEVE